MLSTKGTVAPQTLLILDLVRSRDMRSIPLSAFIPTQGEVSDRYRSIAAGVQRVGSTKGFSLGVTPQDLGTVRPLFHDLFRLVVLLLKYLCCAVL